MCLNLPLRLAHPFAVSRERVGFRAKRPSQRKPYHSDSGFAEVVLSEAEGRAEKSQPPPTTRARHRADLLIKPGKSNPKKSGTPPLQKTQEWAGVRTIF
jgi:hypothetical protein